MALQQQAGRGQWGRKWFSPPGGLYLSVVLVSPKRKESDAISHSLIPADQTPQLTICSALGIAQCLRKLDVPVTLKWPNDLLLNGKKLGGILTETTIQDGQISAAILGVGINWCNSVPESAIQLKPALHNPPQITSLEHLTAVILQGIESGYLGWRTRGINALLPNYLSLVTTWPSTQTTLRLSDTLVLSLKSLQ